MSRGMPVSVKCPKCKRGMYGCQRKVKGIRRVGIEDTKITKSGGWRQETRRGHRGKVECLDCGHTWLTMNPAGGFVRCSEAFPCERHRTA